MIISRQTSLVYLYILLILFAFSSPLFAEQKYSGDDIYQLMQKLSDPSISELDKKRITAVVYVHLDTYRDAVMGQTSKSMRLPSNDEHIQTFLKWRKEMIRDVVEEMNIVYRNRHGRNISAPIIPFGYNNIRSDDDLILGSGKTGQELEEIFNESLHKVVQERAGRPMTASDRARIDVNGLAWDMTEEGTFNNYFHPEKYIHPASGSENQQKLRNSRNVTVYGFDPNGRVVKLPRSEAVDAISALAVDKPLEIPGIERGLGTASMSDYYRMARMHRVSLNPGEFERELGQFIRNQKYTDRLADKFIKEALESDKIRFEKHREFLNLSAELNKQESMRGVAEVFEKYGVTGLVDRELDSVNVGALRLALLEHQNKQLQIIMPTMTGAVARAEAIPMIKWLSDDPAKRRILRKKLATTYVTWDDASIEKILGDIRESGIQQKDVALFEQALTKDRWQIRRYAAQLHIEPGELASRLKINGTNHAILDFIETKNSNIRNTMRAISSTRGGDKARLMISRTTAKALNLDVILEGSTWSKVQFSGMTALSVASAYASAPPDKKLAAIGKGLLETIPFVSTVFKISEMEYKESIKEFVIEVCPPLMIAEYAGQFLGYVAVTAYGNSVTNPAWESLVEQALLELDDNNFEETAMDYYRLKRRQEYLEYIIDAAPGFTSGVVNLSALVAPQIDALMAGDNDVQLINEALYGLNDLESFNETRLTARVREHGIPAQNDARQVERVAGRLIMDKLKRYQVHYRAVMSDFVGKVEKAYNERKRVKDPDSDLSVLSEAIDQLKLAYDTAPGIIKNDSVASVTLREEYIRYQDIIRLWDTEDRDELDIRRELMAIIEEFRLFIKDLASGLMLFQEYYAMNLQTVIYGGRNAMDATEELLLSDTFRLGLRARIKNERAGLTWTAFYYAVNPVDGGVHLLGSKRLQSSRYQRQGDFYIIDSDLSKESQLKIDGSLLYRLFNEESSYEFFAVMAIGSWVSDPHSEIGYIALTNPTDRASLFEEDKVAYAQAPVAVRFVKPELEISVPPFVYTNGNQSIETYLRVPEYAESYPAEASLEILGVHDISLTPAIINPLSLSAGSPSSTDLVFTEETAAGKYFLRVKTSIRMLSKEGQPSENNLSFVYTQQPDPEQNQQNAQASCEKNLEAVSSIRATFESLNNDKTSLAEPIKGLLLQLENSRSQANRIEQSAIASEVSAERVLQARQSIERATLALCKKAAVVSKTKTLESRESLLSDVRNDYTTLKKSVWDAEDQMQTARNELQQTRQTYTELTRRNEEASQLLDKINSMDELMNAADKNLSPIMESLLINAPNECLTRLNSDYDDVRAMQKSLTDFLTPLLSQLSFTRQNSQIEEIASKAELALSDATASVETAELFYEGVVQMDTQAKACAALAEQDASAPLNSLRTEAQFAIQECDTEQARQLIEQLGDSEEKAALEAKYHSLIDNTEQLKDRIGIANQDYVACAYDKALGVLNEALAQATCEKHVASIRRKITKVEDRKQHEQKTRSLFGLGNDLYKDKDYDRALDTLRQAEQHTKCPKYTDKIRVAIDKVEGRIAITAQEAELSRAHVSASCAKNYAGSTAVWEDYLGQYVCGCIGELEWNSEKTACERSREAQVADARELCQDKYPNSEPYWDEHSNLVRCKCFPGYNWNTNGTQCINPRLVSSYDNDLNNSSQEHSTAQNFEQWSQILDRINEVIVKSQQNNDTSSGSRNSASSSNNSLSTSSNRGTTRQNAIKKCKEDASKKRREVEEKYNAIDRAIKKRLNLPSWSTRFTDDPDWQRNQAEHTKALEDVQTMYEQCISQY